jgi:hypothetical protein
MDEKGRAGPRTFFGEIIAHMAEKAANKGCLSGDLWYNEHVWRRISSGFVAVFIIAAGTFGGRLKPRLRAAAAAAKSAFADWNYGVSDIGG